jgi:hypothetical protein
VTEFPYSDLSFADIVVDAIYIGGRSGNAGDDPLPRLIRVDSQGGFRKRGSVKGRLEMLVLTSSMNDPDWPDHLDRETGVFTYFGDNKKPGRELHETGRQGNEILRRIFADSRGGADARAQVPPIFIFSSTGTWRDVRFLGLAVPGASDLDASEELVAIWRTSENSRFQNYRARFTVLDVPVVSRAWIDSIIDGNREDRFAPPAWLSWIRSGRRSPLIATRSIEHRTKQEQIPQDDEGIAVIAAIHGFFENRSHDFEYFAAAIARLMIPDIATMDVTRPSRDGGRDAIGQLRIGRGPSSILADFSLEAKCYALNNSVGVREISRLISRLRHRQFGVLVTTSYLDLQAYKEIKEDMHPIVVISAADIVELLRTKGYAASSAVSVWLNDEFPATR